MISIAMATYNGSKYLREQLNSILKQTYQDFELVVCDDCSTDNTICILEEYAKVDSRIHIYVNPVNLGFKKNFEGIIDKCKYEYVALCDQDDVWLPDHLEVLMDSMTDNVLLCCGKPICVDQNKKILSKNQNYFYMYNCPLDNNDIARHIFLGRSTYQGASMLIRKSFLNMALPIPEGADYHDSWFAAFACICGGMKYIDKPTMLYRRHDNSVTIRSRRISAARRFLSSLLLNHNVPTDRISFINSIRSRLDSLNSNQELLLCRFEKMIIRRKGILGRLRNMPYLLYYFKSIYACSYVNAFK